MSESTIAQKLAVLKDESYVVLAKVDPCGALQARRRRSGAINFYWRYSFGKLSKRELIGPYDRNAPPKSLSPSARGYSIAAAKRAAEDSAQKHYLTRETGGRPAMLAAEAKARIEAEAAQTLAQQQTLAHLMDDYCNYLESQVRISHREARSIFRLHVIEAWPSFSAKQARMLSVEDVADMMRRLVTMGKGRTANKLRSYLGAAFQTAKASRSKGGISFSSLKGRAKVTSELVRGASLTHRD